MPAPPATRPPDLRRHDVLGFQGGMVDINIAGGQVQHATYLYNLRVAREGLELTPGWTVRLTNVPITADDNIIAVRSVPNTDGVIYTFIFVHKEGNPRVPKIYMWNSLSNSVIDVTPTNYSTLWVIPPQVVLYKNKFYTVLPTGVYYLDPNEQSPKFALIPNSPGAATIGVLGFRLVVGNIANGNPWTLRWCALDDPTSWDPLHTLDLPNYDSIWALLPMGDRLLVVTPSRFYLLAYTGSPVTPFAVGFASQLPTTLKTPHQVNTINTHDLKLVVYAIEDGVFVFTGDSSQLISQNIFNYYRNRAYLRPYYVAFDPYSTEVWVYNPSEDYAMVYQVLFKTWYLRDKPQGAWVFFSNRQEGDTIPIVLSYLMPSYVFQSRLPSSIDQRRGDAAVEFTLITPPIEAGEIGGVKTYTSAILWWSNFTDLSLVDGFITVYPLVSHVFGAISHVNDASWTDWSQVLLNSSSIEEVHIHKSGRYIRLKLVGAGITKYMVFHGLMLFWH